MYRIVNNSVKINLYGKGNKIPELEAVLNLNKYANAL